MLKRVISPGVISAQIIADSINVNTNRITTIKITYPRFVHAEMMTHRALSKNGQSSRAVPIETTIENIEGNPAVPIHWGKNRSGMQADQEHNEDVIIGDVSMNRESAWIGSMDKAIVYARAMSDAGYHKQIVNRILEPYSMMTLIITATEYDNFFWLRRHEDAQPEIRELADCVYDAMNASEPVHLEPGEYHLPYIDKETQWECIEYANEHQLDSTDVQLKVSASCCAQVSYRRLDRSVLKAMRIYDRLVAAEPMHASPFEHQARPIDLNAIDEESYWTHIDRDGNYWSGNLKGWIQHRHELPGNTCTRYNA